jgi:serine/threonine protein kinase/tetratricopeptide (TPR) repeat protein
MNEESLFAAAAAIPAADARRKFLEAACGGDVALRRRVEQLLVADDHSRGILERPVPAPAPESRPESLVDGQLFAGRFRLVRKVGAGGMGEVWVADQTEPVQRTVALKLIRHGIGSPQTLKRFDQERQALAVMDHPNIARVFDAGVAGRVPFFAMEYVPGVPITAFCDERRLTVRERLELFAPVCQAIQHAHQKGVVHRDIKPSNVLVAEYEGRPTPKVIDFGVAKVVGVKLTDETLRTGFGAVIGTPEYMSPEQASFEAGDIDTRADVYALGVLLYQLLVGSPPFSRAEFGSGGMLEMLRVVREVEPPRPSARLAATAGLPALAASRGTDPRRLAAAISGELDAVVMKCLAKDRGRRYATANGLAADLRRYLNQEPVEACPPSTGYRVRKFARRHWRGLAAASLFVLLLVAAVVTLSVSLVAVDRERRAKEAALAAEGKRRQQARAALDAMSSQVFADWLAMQPVLAPEHREFLEQAVLAYEEFAADTGRDEESRAGAAAAFGRVGFIREALGQLRDAEAAWDRSRALYTALAGEFPRNPEHRQELARALQSLGVLYYHTGRPREAETVLREGRDLYRRLADETPGGESRRGLARTLKALGAVIRSRGGHDAEAVYQEALAVHRKLVADFPHDPEVRYALVQTLTDFGNLCEETGRPREAEANHREALAFSRRLVDENRTSRRYLDSLAICCNNLGLNLEAQEVYPEAEEVLGEGLGVRRRLAADFPSVPEYQRGLAMTLTNLGILLKNTDRLPEAEEKYAEALALHKDLADKSPAVTDYQNEAAGAMVNLARLRLAGNDPSGARRLLEDALPYHRAALKVYPDHRVYKKFYRLNRWRMTETLLALGEHAAAAAAAAEFLEAATEPPRDSYTAARLFAGCARLAAADDRLTDDRRQEVADAYAARALAALRRAVALNAREVAGLRTDSELAPLRPREEFQKLLRELEVGRGP